MTFLRITARICAFLPTDNIEVLFLHQIHYRMVVLTFLKTVTWFLCNSSNTSILAQFLSQTQKVLILFIQKLLQIFFWLLLCCFLERFFNLGLHYGCSGGFSASRPFFYISYEYLLHVGV